MRRLTREERVKRKCCDCPSEKRISRRVYKGDGLAKAERVYVCAYDECPYHELDDVKNYGEYLRSVDRGGARYLLSALGLK